jgi:hypothetical protein
MLDVDGDDQCDILAQRLPDLIWLEADDHAASSFNARTVASGLGVTGHGSSQGFALGDITGDGRLEYVVTAGDGIHYVIVAATSTGSRTVWAKNGFVTMLQPMSAR